MRGGAGQARVAATAGLPRPADRDQITQRGEWLTRATTCHRRPRSHGDTAGPWSPTLAPQTLPSPNLGLPDPPPHSLANQSTSPSSPCPRSSYLHFNILTPPAQTLYKNSSCPRSPYSSSSSFNLRSSSSFRFLLLCSVPPTLGVPVPSRPFLGFSVLDPPILRLHILDPLLLAPSTLGPPVLGLPILGRPTLQPPVLDLFLSHTPALPRPPVFRPPLLDCPDLGPLTLHCTALGPPVLGPCPRPPPPGNYNSRPLNIKPQSWILFPWVASSSVHQCLLSLLILGHRTPSPLVLGPFSP